MLQRYEGFFFCTESDIVNWLFLVYRVFSVKICLSGLCKFEVSKVGLKW